MRAKPCDKSMPTPKHTSVTGGPTGSFHVRAKSKTTTTAPSVFQCREWIPDEPLADRMTRALQEHPEKMMTCAELCAACNSTENTVNTHMKTLVANGVAEVGHIKIKSGSAQRLCRAYRLLEGR